MSATPHGRGRHRPGRFPRWVLAATLITLLAILPAATGWLGLAVDGALLVGMTLAVWRRRTTTSTKTKIHTAPSGQKRDSPRDTP